MEDGCPNAGHSPTLPSLNPGISSSYEAAVRCCRHDGKACITPTGCFKTTYEEARSICNGIGTEWRLCTTNELKGNKCCGTGCGFDDKLTWANFNAGWYLLIHKY